MAKAKILVVDDNPFICRLLETRLKANDYEVDTVLNGPDALAKVQEQGVDLILLDISMPGMDGIEVGHRLKEDHKTRAIPIIMVTARGEHSTVVKAVAELNPVGYIVKPFNPDILLKEVEKALTKKTQE